MPKTDRKNRSLQDPRTRTTCSPQLRWHPDVPIIAWVKPGEDFIMETYDWTGGFIKNNNSADDVRDIDLSIVHFLSGPIGVEGAEPGDLLVVGLLDVGAPA